jgi:hypothetical protein
MTEEQKANLTTKSTLWKIKQISLGFIAISSLFLAGKLDNLARWCALQMGMNIWEI